MGTCSHSWEVKYGINFNNPEIKYNYFPKAKLFLWNRYVSFSCHCLCHTHIQAAFSTFCNILHLSGRWQTRPSIRSRGCSRVGVERRQTQDQLHHTVFFSAMLVCPVFNTLPLGHAWWLSAGGVAEYQMKTEGFSLLY